MDSIIFVCGLPEWMNDGQLYEIFSPYGAVKSAWVCMDTREGRSRGFGFVEMPRIEEARAAIAAWNNTRYEGQTLFVIEAKPRIVESPKWPLSRMPGQPDRADVMQEERNGQAV